MLRFKALNTLPVPGVPHSSYASLLMGRVASVCVFCDVADTQSCQTSKQRGSFQDGDVAGRGGKLLHLVQCQVLFLHFLRFNLIKIVIDILPKPLVPIGNLQQSSECGIVAGCRIERDGAAAAFKLLGMKQVLAKLFAQVHIHLAKRAMALDEVVEMLIDKYRNILKPMHDEFIEPTKQYADIIIPNGGNNQKAIEILKLYIEKILGR